MFVVSKLAGKDEDLLYSIRDAILAQAKSWARELRIKPLKDFYSYNIRYQPESTKSLAEEWVDPYTVVKRGYGDCDDMVIFRLAQLFNQFNYDLNSLSDKLPAWPAVAWQEGTGRYHVFIGLPSGKYEDPAKIQAKKFGYEEAL